MEQVNISELRANLLSYLKKAQRGEVIRVTSHGQLLATISPPHEQSDAARLKLKQLAESAVLHDILSPIDEEWEAML